MRKCILKVYAKDGFSEFEVDESLFPNKAIKNNDNIVSDFLNEKYPMWYKAIVIFEYPHVRQRHLVEKLKCLK